MIKVNHNERRDHKEPEGLTRAHIQEFQFQKISDLFRTVVPANSFYHRKYAHLKTGSGLSSLKRFSEYIPFTTKAELTEDQEASPPYGTNLSFPLSDYVRCHQTSGSTGTPLRWLDTRESWSALLDVWDEIFAAAGVTAADRLFFAFSFGPFIGFWSAFEAATRKGCFCFTAGAMNSEARLHAILDHRCTILLCTPTYALHLGQEARALGIDLSSSCVRLIITAGEPGGSIPAVRARIASAWPGARVFDHHGMTEAGPVTYECPAQPGVLHVVESAFLAEVIQPGGAESVPRGTTGELILTTLHRTGSPLIRYRTGDLVRVQKAERCVCGRHEIAFAGGIMGRSDDMVIVRGVNVYPAAVDNIVRGFKGVAEYRVHLSKQQALAEMSIEIEPAADLLNPEILAQRLRCAFHSALGLRVPITLARPGSLPRFEMKGKRWERSG